MKFYSLKRFGDLNERSDDLAFFLVISRFFRRYEAFVLSENVL